MGLSSACFLRSARCAFAGKIEKLPRSYGFNSKQGQITALGFKMERKNTVQCLSGLRMESMSTESSELSGEEGFLPTTAAKT